jgi:hypothetical protein
VIAASGRLRAMQGVGHVELGLFGMSTKGVAGGQVPIQVNGAFIVAIVERTLGVGIDRFSAAVFFNLFATAAAGQDHGHGNQAKGGETGERKAGAGILHM